MKKIFLMLIILMSISACSSCLIKEGIYSNFGGSEYSITLKLLDDGTFAQKYELWSAGKKDKSEETIQGHWTCRDNRIELEAGNKTHDSIITRVGENPLAINDDVKVLHFEEGGFEHLSREIMYPISELNNK